MREWLKAWGQMALTAALILALAANAYYTRAAARHSGENNRILRGRDPKFDALQSEHRALRALVEERCGR